MPTNTQQTITRGGLEFVKCAENEYGDYRVMEGEYIIGWLLQREYGYVYDNSNVKLPTASDLRTIADFMDELNAQQTAGEAG